MRILGIETSCDETAAAVVENGTKVRSNVVASSHTMHEKYGGIVPEVAAREQLRCIIPVIKEAAPSMDDVDAIAVTVGPGLIGSLLVGVETAKTIAFVTNKPIIPVNHVIAHVYANFVIQSSKLKFQNGTIEFPAIALVASGGHTELYVMKSATDLTWLGGTIDDAAGECFDKCARLLGFGHGGGPAIQAAAEKFQSSRLKFHVSLPRPMLDESYNFSFSGLKTAVMREWNKANDPSLAPAFAYEIEEAITDVLVKKTLRAATRYSAQSVLLSGGVAANSRLREKLAAYHSQVTIVAPQVQLCTDNAVAIASAAYFLGSPTSWRHIIALPDLPAEHVRFPLYPS